MYTRIVTFHLAGLSAGEYSAVAEGAAESFAEWPGLISKLWLTDDQSNTYGGVYVFASAAAAAVSRLILRGRMVLDARACGGSFQRTQRGPRFLAALGHIRWSGKRW